MISVCIPVYNFNITSLLTDLLKSTQQLQVPYEIICIDDGSEKEYREVNKKAAVQQVYIQLETNIGRAKIRNLFLQYARYENLLFLDCDSLLISTDFLSTYIEYINQNKNYNVVCGGRVYNSKPPKRNQRLRWLYGIKKESQNVNTRNRFPNAAFMSNNFLIRKIILSEVRFDERLTGYGHEDTLFGYALQKKKILISHINNPVLNGHLENNKEYLLKTEKGIINLVSILRYVNNDPDFINDVKLLRVYHKVTPLTPVIAISFIVLKPAIKWLLSNGYINIALFQFYKIGILLKNSKRNNAVFLTSLSEK